MADLKVIKVFIQDNKQVGYKVMRADGSIIDVPREQMIQAISLGHSYSNATVSNSGVVRVDSNVPREDISVNKKPAKVLDYKGDITGFLKEGKTITRFHSFNQYDHFKEGNFRTFYVPAGIVDKAINRCVDALYIDPDKVYEKHIFKVSVEEAKKYEEIGLVPKIHNFENQHGYTLVATDDRFTSFNHNCTEEFKDYNTITVWIYLIKPHYKGYIPMSLIDLAMAKDILDVAESRYNDLKNSDIGLKKLSAVLLHSAFINCFACNVGYCEYRRNEFTFFDERIYIRSGLLVILSILSC